MSKLPGDIYLEIVRKAKAEVSEMDDLLNTIKVEIKVRQVSEGRERP